MVFGMSVFTALMEAVPSPLLVKSPKACAMLDCEAKYREELRVMSNEELHETIAKSLVA